MKATLVCSLLALAVVNGFCSDGDDMVITEFTQSRLGWTNCLPGTACTVLQRTSLAPEGAWTVLVPGIVTTSRWMTVTLPPLPASPVFLRVSRPFDPLLGLVAWYQFEGNALDASGWNNNGTNSGVGFEAGMAGLAGRFDGSGAHIRVPQNASLKLTGVMTICAWVKPQATDGLRCIVDKDYGLVGYNLYIDSGGLHMRICGSAITAGSVTNGGWQHVAGVYTGDKIRIFVNGIHCGETGSGALADRDDKDVYIGMWGPPGGPARYFTGWMDNVRIYARPLTPMEIGCLAASGQ